MSASRPIKYPEPEGKLSASTLRALEKGTIIYGVWRRDGRIQKIIIGSKGGYDKSRLWCEKESERRAFTNYFHAYAHSLRIKERRTLDKVISATRVAV